MIRTNWETDDYGGREVVPFFPNMVKKQKYKKQMYSNMKGNGVAISK